MRPGLGLLLACGLAAGQDFTEPTPQPTPTPDDLAQGERLFGAQCAYCHGPKGDGGRGANLARPRLRHAADDLALFQVISRGLPGSVMPPSGMSARQIWQVVAYARTLGRITQPATAPGDSRRGEKLYAGKGGCAGCHTIAGHGGAVGPDLTDIGARSSMAHLRAALLDPEAAVPADFLQLRVVTRDGRIITGVRINEDVFSIQMRDLSDRFHSFWKSELVELDKDWGKSPMPSYRTVFTPAEIDDITAYLVSLQGGQ